MPDFRNVFPSSPDILSQIGIRAVPGLSASALAVNACMQCHNSNLDQTLTRAKFNVNAMLNGTMSAAEKAVTVQRILAPSDSVTLMPPLRFRTLLPSEQQILSITCSNERVT